MHMGRMSFVFTLAVFVLSVNSADSADLTPKVALPVFYPAAGTYSSTQTVKISDATAGATIHYTTNGALPTSASAIYIAPLTISASLSIKAFAETPQHVKSAIVSADYDMLQSVLSKLNEAATSFHTTSADVEFDTTQTDPVPDTDVQKGVVYYQRNNSTFQMGVHIATDNAQPAPKVVVCCAKGSIQLYEKLPNQVTTLSKLSQYESWFMLGFGASGTELQEKWDITYAGPETIDGVKTAKLEMVPKDPAVKKTVPKVILWLDTSRAVSLKQYFDEGQGQSRTCHYTNIKVNQSLPKDAFAFKTDSKTTYVNR